MDGALPWAVLRVVVMVANLIFMLWGFILIGIDFGMGWFLMAILLQLILSLTSWIEDKAKQASSDDNEDD